SEFTIMRASSMSTGLAGLMLVKIGIVFVVITFAFGEFVVPHTSNLAQRTKMLGKGQSLSSEFRSGLWTKDVIRSDGMTGETIGSRFLNVGAAQANGQLQGLKIYEFNNNFHLVSLITAAKAEYQGDNRWLLHDGSEAKFSDTSLDQPNKTSDLTDAIATERFSSRTLISEMTPEILSVGFTDPEQMSAIDLVSYTNYLSENNRETARYEIAFWKKVFYPFAVFVMMALALPFAYLHFRSGGVSLKIFTGIMIGVSFQLINSLFSHLGLLNTWPAFATAILPSALFMLAAVGALMWVERR
ncbi:MAG: LPS export ABC transporter permease LptG, partial [Oxalicibacterium faecigallinarum]|uniref:LPS export ABC transporter permease LptG n=1 Tax=Oxalicibacterium faecigallinarum TaxID=573741 RepID=UPI0028088FEF